MEPASHISMRGQHGVKKSRPRSRIQSMSSNTGQSDEHGLLTLNQKTYAASARARSINVLSRTVSFSLGFMISILIAQL